MHRALRRHENRGSVNLLLRRTEKIATSAITRMYAERLHSLSQYETGLRKPFARSLNGDRNAALFLNSNA
jgi:hypothetical protein